MRIQKRTGELEDFSRQKLEESLKRAGASADVAKRVSERIDPSEGQTTAELRRKVAEELRRENATLSVAYMTTKRLSARPASDVSAGVARIHEDLLRSLNIRPGHVAHLSLGGREAEVRVEKASETSPREIHLSREDFEKLGAREGSRLDVRFSK